MELVALPEAVPELGVAAGTLGAVDHVYGDGRRVDVEISREDGTVVGYVTMETAPEPHVVAYYVEED